jgi:hypothetical protein
LAYATSIKKTHIIRFIIQLHALRNIYLLCLFILWIPC